MSPNFSSSSSDSDLSNTKRAVVFDTPTNAQKPTTTKSNFKKQSDVLKQIKFQANDPMMDLDITPSYQEKRTTTVRWSFEKEDLKDKIPHLFRPHPPSVKRLYQNEAVDADFKKLKREKQN